MEKRFFLILLLLATRAYSTQLIELPVDRDHLVLLHTELGKYYCVSYLYNPLDDKTYIIKQKNELFDEKRRALQAVRELLGTYTANLIDIPSQQVWFIPADMSFAGKFFDNLVATLHAVVPGSMVKNCPSWNHLDIRQRQLGKSGEGLTRQVIKSMSLHNDLPGIVALDTMGGNCGRHNKNYFYDEHTNHFYVIDMGGFYKRSHVVATCRNIERIINDYSIRFSESEMRAITRYRTMLIRIQQKISKQGALDKLNEFVSQGNFAPIVADYVTHSISKCLIDNYAMLDTLIHMLQLLIEDKKYSYKFAQVSDL